MAWLQDVDALSNNCNAMAAGESRKRPAVVRIDEMNYLQHWLEQLSPLTSLASIATIFMIASIAGLYAGNLIEWFRR
jgi:hypothetical protein